MPATKIFKRLVQKGYFPIEMVPWFNTEKLSEILPILELVIKDGAPWTSKCCSYSIPKGKTYRRKLSVPNPLQYMRLCKTIEENWTELRKIITSPTAISLSTPDFKSSAPRAISRKYSLEEICENIISSSTCSRYMLRTDISRYYSTIYTHSIPWAIHTKEIAKKDRSEGLLGNKLDTCIRNCQDGQTIGIPIGPDTSLLISEIIGVSMDKLLVSKIKAKSSFRYIDDYYLFFNNISEANNAFSELSIVVSEFELELNRNKTKILELPEPMQPIWVSELNIVPKNKIELLSYINKSFEYYKKDSDAEILLFSLSRLNSRNINIKEWGLAMSYILNIMIHEPSAIPLATEILINYSYRRGYKIDKKVIYETIEEIILYHSNDIHEFEVCWCLWLCNMLKIYISVPIAKKISSIRNPFVALVALNLERKGLITVGLDKRLWQSYMKSEELYTENWILAYEAYVDKLLPSVDGIDYISKDWFFKILSEQNIRFFDALAPETWIKKSIDEKWLYGGLSSAY